MRATRPAVASDRPLLVCLSHLRWDFVLQRPQHLLLRAAADHDVMFIEEPVFETGLPAPRMEQRQAAPGVTVCVPVLPHGLEVPQAEAALRALTDDALAPLLVRRQLILWYYTPMALPWTAHLRADAVVYDCMDELTAFKGAPVRLPLLERQLVRRADLVFTGGRSLYEAKRRLHPRTYCFPSSVDRAHYDRARGHGLRDPADQAKLPRPRIGFFGVIDERLDTGLVGEVAARRPDWQLVMVGPIVKIDAARLPRLPNLSWLGIKPYAELPDYLAHWDAGWMPFARNEATRYISPTKTPEFLAAGLPLVSTPIDDVVRDYGGDGLVEIAGDAQGCIAALARAMGRPRAPWLQQVDGRLRSMSWDRTWSTMQGLLAKVLDGGARPAAAMAGPVVPGTVVGEPAVGGIAAHA